MVLQTPRPFAEMTVRENVVLGALFGSIGRVDSEATAFERAEEALGFVRLADGRRRRRHAEPPRAALPRARPGARRPAPAAAARRGDGRPQRHRAAGVDRDRAHGANELGVTVIWVEHVMKAVLSLAERIVVLNFGRVLADGAPHDVMRDPDVVTAYLGAAEGRRCWRSLTSRPATSARTSSTARR